MHPLAGHPAPASVRLDTSALLAAYIDLRPDPAVSAQRVSFGTSGHRGCAFDRSFNEWHILAISQAVCDLRSARGIDGPLYLGIDTHALSQPAFESTMSVLAANGVEVRVAGAGEYTPTPAISHAILAYNHGRTHGLADGIVLTPSHNPPEHGGFKYNPPDGGPADSTITDWIQNRANTLLVDDLRGVRHVPFVQAMQAGTTAVHDYLHHYTADLDQVIDFDSIRSAGIHMAVDPLGGAGVHYWGVIAERYRIDLTVLRTTVDPTFAFMTLDHDGKIRMDPSSPWAMRQLLAGKDRFDLTVACDTDHDRHGIITPGAGLLPANHYLAVMVDYLFQHRPEWSTRAAVGKTVVSSAMIDRVAARLHRPLMEVPVGFKWFVSGLLDGSLGFVGEESAGASFLRRSGAVWTTDKDGFVPSLLAAEISARTGRDPGARFRELCHELGEPLASRIDAAATPAQKARLSKLSPDALQITSVAGERVLQILNRAPGNGGALGGIKVTTANGWFAARPSGTEDIYKIYAESFLDEAHLKKLLEEAQQIVDATLASDQAIT